MPCWHQKLGDMLLTVYSFYEDAPARFGDGFRMAVVFDGVDVEHWLCDDVHASEDEARACLRNGCTHGKGPHWNEDVARACVEHRRAIRTRSSKGLGAQEPGPPQSA